MTCGELIEELKKFDPAMAVKIVCEHGYEECEPRVVIEHDGRVQIVGDAQWTL